MNDVEIKERAEAEQNRINEILKEVGISERRMKLLAPVILNTAWMKAKLDDSREAIKNSGVVIAYDNGGGQKGIRENPLFKGYEGLFKTYMSGLKQILDVLPPYEVQVKAEEIEKPKTVLELVRSKKKEAV